MVIVACESKTKWMAWLCCMCIVLTCACSTVTLAVMHDAVLRRDLVEEVLSLETDWNVSVYDGNRDDASDANNWHTLNHIRIERDYDNNAFTLSFIYNYSMCDDNKSSDENNAKHVQMKMSMLCERIRYSVQRVNHDDNYWMEDSVNMQENIKRKQQKIKGQCFLEMSDVAKTSHNLQAHDNTVEDDNTQVDTHVESESNEVYFMYSVRTKEDKQENSKFVREGKVNANNDDKESNNRKITSFISLYASTLDDDGFADETQEMSVDKPSAKIVVTSSHKSYIGEIMLVEQLHHLSTPPQYTLTFYFATLFNSSNSKQGFQSVNTTRTSQHSKMSNSRQENSVLKYKLPRALTLHGLVQEDHTITEKQTAYLAMAQTSNVWTRWGYPIVFVMVLYLMGWLLVKCVALQQRKANVTARTTAAHCSQLHKHHEEEQQQEKEEKQY